MTGAGQGIGRAIAERFVAEGARVIAADLRFSDGPGGPLLEQLVLDVTDEAEVIAAAARHPDVAVLVNCAGSVATGALLESTPDDFDRSIAINAKSMMLTMKAFLPAMLARREGSVVNIASVVSSVMAAPERFAYATAKAAVIGMTMSVARDYIAHGIRCNAISPGTVDSPSLRERFAATGDPEAAHRAFLARQPMGRLGDPDEVAAVAVLLASDEARFMTGSNMVIDGGMSL